MALDSHGCVKADTEAAASLPSRKILCVLGMALGVLCVEMGAVGRVAKRRSFAVRNL